VKVVLDADLCEAYGTCVAAAPDVFALDEDIDKAVLLIESPDESLRSEVEEAVRACPVRAIQITEQ
jgi:ferredoxin